MPRWASLDGSLAMGERKAEGAYLGKTGEFPPHLAQLPYVYLIWMGDVKFYVRDKQDKVWPVFGLEELKRVLDGRDISNVLFCDFYVLTTKTGLGYAKRISRNTDQENDLLDDCFLVALACNAGLDDGILTRCPNLALPGGRHGLHAQVPGLTHHGPIKQGGVGGHWGQARHTKSAPTLSEGRGTRR
jgi:hypothetical protein